MRPKVYHHSVLGVGACLGHYTITVPIIWIKNLIVKLGGADQVINMLSPVCTVEFNEHPCNSKEVDV